MGIFRFYSHRFYFGIALISVLLVGACRSSRGDQPAAGAPTAAWQQQPLVIDGFNSDWAKPLPYFDSKEKIAYGVSNDRDNIYILLSTRDPLEQRKILEGGLTVWINSQAEKNENTSVGIGFPTDSRNNRERNLMAAAQPDAYKNKPISPDDLRDYSLFGFNKEEPVEHYDYDSSNAEGIQVKINLSSLGELVYEASIPLASIYPKSSTPFAKSIAVGFFMDGLPPQAGRRNGGIVGSGVGVGVGGGLGFGSFGSGGGLGLSIGSGIGGRRNDPNQALYKEGRIWQVLPLARPGIH
jgi:hypothetical protein